MQTFLTLFLALPPSSCPPAVLRLKPLLCFFGEMPESLQGWGLLVIR